MDEMDVVATIDPCAFVARSPLGMLVMAKLVVVAFVSVVVPRAVVPVKVLFPENVLAFARSVDDAAVMVMFAVPSKDVPLMVRGV